jgi:hypothetical protein
MDDTVYLAKLRGVLIGRRPCEYIFLYLTRQSSKLYPRRRRGASGRMSTLLVQDEEPLLAVLLNIHNCVRSLQIPHDPDI